MIGTKEKLGTNEKNLRPPEDDILVINGLEHFELIYLRCFIYNICNPHNNSEKQIFLVQFTEGRVKLGRAGLDYISSKYRLGIKDQVV